MKNNDHLESSLLGQIDPKGKGFHAPFYPLSERGINKINFYFHAFYDSNKYININGAHLIQRTGALLRLSHHQSTIWDGRAKEGGKFSFLFLKKRQDEKNMFQSALSLFVYWKNLSPIVSEQHLINYRRKRKFKKCRQLEVVRCFTMYHT